MTYLDRTIAPTATLLADHPAPVGDAPPRPRDAPPRPRDAPPRPRDVPRVGAGGSYLAPLLSVLFGMIDETHSMVINVTAANPGAGTSTLSRKLAEAAAATGWCRVALLDAVPALDDVGPGLVEMIEQGERPSLVSGRLGSMGVDTGRLTTAGRELSRIESLRRVYGSLRDRYTLVIVDCPAVFAGQQTLMVAAAADETVLVVEAERTALDDVARARAALERRGAGVLGMVMNKSRMRSSRLFGR